MKPELAALDDPGKLESPRLELDGCRRELAECGRNFLQSNCVLADIADAIFITDSNGSIVEVNPAATELLGYSKSELLKMHPSNFLMGVSREEIESTIREVTRQTPLTAHHVCRDKYGQQRPMELRWSRHHFQGCDLVVAICRDAGERQKIGGDLESTLREAEELQKQQGESQDYLRLIIDTIPVLAWCSLPDGPVEFLNKRWLDYTGLSTEIACGWGWKEAIHPEELPQLLEIWQEILVSGIAGEFEARLRRFDGEYRWFLFRAEPLRDVRGTIVRWYGTNTDIDDRKRAETLLAGEYQVLKMIAEDNSLAEILEGICSILDDASEDSLASILLLDPDGKHLRWGAGPRFPEPYKIAADGVEIGPSVCSCGTAVYRKKQVIVTDIATDPLWINHRDFALGLGLQACWSTPIPASDGNVLGTFALYWRKPCKPAPHHYQIIKQITHLTAVAIERTRSRDAIIAAKARFGGILEIADDAIISVDSNRNILLFNRGAERVFGFDQAEAIGKSLDLLLPNQLSQGQESRFEKVAKISKSDGLVGQWYEVFGKKKDGSEFPAEASISKLDLGDQVVFTVILRDATERKRAADILQASEVLARGQLAALTHTLDALAQESNPDQLLGHVLRTIVELTGAQGASVYDRKPDSDWLEKLAAIENGHFEYRRGSMLPIAGLSTLKQDHEVWSNVLRLGQHAVLEDITQPIVRMCVGSGTDATWHEVMNDQGLDPAFFRLKAHFRAVGVRTVLFVPMLIAGQVMGLVAIRFTTRRSFRPDEIELPRALAHQAMLAIQLTCLSAQSRESAVIAERNRMARDIHDTLAQGFTGVILQLEAAEEAMSLKRDEKTSEHIRRAGELARESLREARRSVRALRPRALQGKSMCEALEALIKNMTAGTTVKSQFVMAGEPRELDPKYEADFLHIVQEALTNVLRHSRADEFIVQAIFETEEVRFNLRDNGCGFDVVGKHEGFGLEGMKERTEGMGGQLSIQSSSGAGTMILITLPIQSNAAPANYE